MTRVENFAAPAAKSSNSFSALMVNDNDSEMKNSNPSGLNCADFHVPPVQDKPDVRKSSRTTKASPESLKDETKVFSSPLGSSAVKSTAAAFAPSVVNETKATLASTLPTNDMDTSHVQDSSNANTSPPIRTELSLSEEMAFISSEIAKFSPHMAAVVENFMARVSSEIETLKNSLSFASLTSNVPAAVLATSGKRPHTKSAHTANRPPVDIAARNKALVAAWEAKPTLNGNKRVCTDPIDDQHLNPEDDQFMIVHMSGFDLLPNEHRATPTAILTEKFGLAPHSIVNVSPMGPQLQELHIIASKLPSLREAVSKTNGRLKISTKLDPRLPALDTTDPNALAESNARFKERMNRDIARLSATNSRRLKSLADFLAQYRDEGLRKSEPRTRPRRMQMYASAFFDEAVFDQPAFAPTMVADQI